MAKLEPLIPGK